MRRACADEEKLRRERKLQQAMLDVKKRYGKNAMVKGMNLLEGATTMERNRSGKQVLCRDGI